MNTHAEIGYDLLRSLPFLAEEADAAYAHHERHDGGGYPRQIAGDDIPLMARIVAVADSFDALRFNRPYRAAIPLDKVVKMITVDSAKQFNPEVLKAFSRCQLGLLGQCGGLGLVDALQPLRQPCRAH